MIKKQFAMEIVLMGRDGSDKEADERESTINRLEGMVGQPHIHEHFLRFRVDLLRAQLNIRKKLEQSSAWLTIRIQSGSTLPVPPLVSSLVSYENDLLHEMFSRLNISAAKHGHQTEDLRRLTALVEADSLFLASLANATGPKPDHSAIESISRRSGIYHDALLFVGRCLVAPFFTTAAKTLTSSGAHPVNQDSHRCGFCGSQPSIARLRRTDGRRILTCGLCGMDWEGKRLACPCCGNQKPEVLGLLRLSDTSPRWIETCDSCMGYIKTTDERRLPEGEPAIPVIEESSTLHLDLLAEREGYFRTLPYTLCV